MSLDKRKGLFLTQVEHQDKHDSKPNEEELTQCGWENLIGDDADNLLIFDPSTEADAFDGPNENSQENDVKLCNSFPSSLQRDVADDVAEGLQLNVSFLPCPEEMNSVPDVDHIKEQVEMDQTPQIFLENFQNHSLTSDRNHKLDYGFTSGISIACKVTSRFRFFTNLIIFSHRCFFSLQ